MNTKAAMALVEVAGQLKSIAEMLMDTGDGTVNVPVVVTPTVIEPTLPIPQPVTPILPHVGYNNNTNNPSTYDPAPPFRVEPVPPRPEINTDEIVITKDTVFVCSTCKKQVVQAIRDVDRSSEAGKGLGLDAFKELLPGILGEEVRIRREATGLAIDCPLCNSTASIWLFGGSAVPSGGV